MRLSVLVVSRTPGLLSRMLLSLSKACSLPYEDVEILCSWNGLPGDEKAIDNGSGYEFLIAQRDQYHFSANMNSLAERANGELLLLINDDVCLDPGSIDAAINGLQNLPAVGLIGARLRNEEGLLTHCGIVFDSHFSPYHQLDQLVGSEHQLVTALPRTVPAVTGALMLICRENFLALQFETSYRVCGEDVQLCLDLRERMELDVVVFPAFSGVHVSESTRSQVEAQASGNDEDLVRLRARYRAFLELATSKQLRDDLQAKSWEADVLRSMEISRKAESDQIRQLLAELRRRENDPDMVSRSELIKRIRQGMVTELAEEFDFEFKKEIKSLEDEVLHWQQQSHSLQIARLRLEQEMTQLRRGS